jgi:hypothetical protein
LALAFVGGSLALAQATLPDAAKRAEAAWRAHDAAGLVGRSAAVVLQLPGADPSAALGRAQAVELLRRHFQSATERRVAVAAIHEREPGRGVVELDRVYVVRGTDDARRETVFLGFQLLNGTWHLVEVRTAQ